MLIFDNIEIEILNSTNKTDVVTKNRQGNRVQYVYNR